MENPVPKNPGIPGFSKIPSRKIPGLKFLIPLGPAHHHLLGFPITETDSIAFTELVICNEIGTYFQNMARLMYQF